MKGPPKPPDLLDCYEVLGLNEHASSLDIEKAYKRCRLAYHPDSKRAGAQPSTELFQNIGIAWDILKKKSEKRRYDKSYSILKTDWNIYRMRLGKWYAEQQELKRKIEEATKQRSERINADTRRREEEEKRREEVRRREEEVRRVQERLEEEQIQHAANERLRQQNEKEQQSQTKEQDELPEETQRERQETERREAKRRAAEKREREVIATAQERQARAAEERLRQQQQQSSKPHKRPLPNDDDDVLAPSSEKRPKHEDELSSGLKKHMAREQARKKHNQRLDEVGGPGNEHRLKDEIIDLGWEHVEYQNDACLQCYTKRSAALFGLWRCPEGGALRCRACLLALSTFGS